MIRSAARPATKASAMSAMFECSSGPQLVGQRVGADVELLVEGVDLALAVNSLAEPLALGAAPPDPPVAPIPSLLPAGRLHQTRAALGTDVQLPGWLRLVATGLVHALPIEPGSGALNPHFCERSSTKPNYRVSNCATRTDPVALRPRYHGSMLGNIGPLEIIVVLIIALIVFGPKRLPELGSSLGRGIREFNSSVTGDKSDDDEDDLKAIGASKPATLPPSSRPSPRSCTTNAAEADRDAPPRQGGLPRGSSHPRRAPRRAPLPHRRLLRRPRRRPGALLLAEPPAARNRRRAAAGATTRSCSPSASPSPSRRR